MELKPVHIAEIAGFCLFIVLMSSMAYHSHVYENYIKDIPSAKPDVREMIHSDDLIATDEFLYHRNGKIVCRTWDGTIVWETPVLGGGSAVFAGDVIFTDTYQWVRGKGDIYGIAVIDLEGNILWRKDFDSSVEIGASNKILVAATHGEIRSILQAFSKEGELLWTYTHHAIIDKIEVASDSSCVIFSDLFGYINCLRDNKVVWSKEMGNTDQKARMSTINFYVENPPFKISPDNSYIVYGYEDTTTQIVACTLDGVELWSAAVAEYFRSVAISGDSSSVAAGCLENVYKFTADGTLLWEKKAFSYVECVFLTHDGAYMVIGDVDFLVLNDLGDVLWKTYASCLYCSITQSPDGSHLAFSGCRKGLCKLVIFNNFPECWANLCVYPVSIDYE